MTDKKMLEELTVRWDEISDRYSMNEEEMLWVLKRLKKLKEFEETTKLDEDDIAFKIEERMEKLGEQFGNEHRLNELGLLLNWILCGDDDY